MAQNVTLTLANGEALILDIPADCAEHE
jgi:hypothetical protein